MNAKKLVICMSAATALPCAGLAQESVDRFPSKPVLLITPTVAGGAGDIESRLYAKFLQANTGQQFIVESKAGAGGRIGFGYVAKANPDGYTLLMMTSSFTLAPAIFKTLSYDPVKDFEPVSLMSRRKTVMVARNSFPAQNMKEYIAYARANPGKVNFATAGLGNITHLSGAWLHGATDTKITFVHYKGIAMYPDMLTGRVDVTFDPLNGLATPLLKSGKLKALGISSLTRTSQMPGLPTIAEQLGLPDFEYPSWLGVAGPARTPKPIVDKLSAEFAKVAKTPEVIQRLVIDEGGEMVGSHPEEFRKHLTSEFNRWPRIVKDIAFEPED